jgi:peptidylprolyl isomerase
MNIYVTSVALGCAVTIFSMAIAAQGAPIPPPADVAAAPATAAKTSSGLASRVLTPGKGSERPSKSDLVTVHYTGWTTDGKMFDSSKNSGEPATFPLDRVIPGWTEGVQLMVAGETRRFWIPEKLAYGGNRDPKGMLVFDVELLSFQQSPTQAPADVKAPPADAKKTSSGLAYKVLTPGKGSRKPAATSRVTVHYTGWTTDGKMFDSSVTRGEPATFPLDGVIKGWTEGVQLMVEGEKTRFWIPEAIAYGGRRAPYGVLVFDIELLKIQ